MAMQHRTQQLPLQPRRAGGGLGNGNFRHKVVVCYRGVVDAAHAPPVAPLQGRFADAAVGLGAGAFAAALVAVAHACAPAGRWGGSSPWRRHQRTASSRRCRVCFSDSVGDDSPGHGGSTSSSAGAGPTTNASADKVISEGLAEILPNRRAGANYQDAFYNPVMITNRDLSIVALTAFTDIIRQECEERGDDFKGVTFLDAFAATGLRSLRIAKEVPSRVRRIVANDCDPESIRHIQANIAHNGLEDSIEVVRGDALRMHEMGAFDVIDIDPFGSASPFLDSAMQAVTDGGLLAVTSTDGRVLCGFDNDVSTAWYGGRGIRAKGYTKELALRLLLAKINSCAREHGRRIEPLASLWIDFYARIYVRVRHVQQDDELEPSSSSSSSTSLSCLHQCRLCDSFFLTPLDKSHLVDIRAHGGISFPAAGVGSRCPECQGTFTTGGPFYDQPTWNQEFLQAMLAICEKQQLAGVTSWKRVRGLITALAEEVHDAPLCYSMPSLQRRFRVQTLAIGKYKAALRRLGYEASHQHANPDALKTNAPNRVVFDMLRAWAARSPVPKRGREGFSRVLVDRSRSTYKSAKYPAEAFDFTSHQSPVRDRIPRFPQNPRPHWGPGQPGRIHKSKSMEAASPAPASSGVM